MNPTWEWLISVAAWGFLAGTALVALSALPVVARRFPRAMPAGFLLGVLSIVLVLAAWGLPRLADAVS